MKVFLSAALATAVFASSALADNTASPLAPGKPAGVKDAQMEGVSPVVLVGMAIVVGAIVVAVSHSSHNGSGAASTTTTTGTSP